MTAAILALWTGGINVTEERMEYAYYLIAVKRAKITEPYIVVSDGDPKRVVKVPPVSDLRDWIPEINTKGYQMKMKIVEEFARQGVNYWKTKIPTERLQQIKLIYPDTWREYIKKY